MRTNARRPIGCKDSTNRHRDFSRDLSLLLLTDKRTDKIKVVSPNMSPKCQSPKRLIAQTHSVPKPQTSVAQMVCPFVAQDTCANCKTVTNFKCHISKELEPETYKY